MFFITSFLSNIYYCYSIPTIFYEYERYANNIIFVDEKSNVLIDVNV